MYLFDSKLMAKRRQELKMSYRDVESETKRIDPKGNGVSCMTVQRIEKAVHDPSVSSVLLICAALGIAPSRVFKTRTIVRRKKHD